MIKTVIFDIGNVVLFFDHKRMIRQLAHTLGVPFETVGEIFFKNGLLTNLELGKATTTDLIHTLNQLSKKAPSQENLLLAFNDIFHENETLIPVLHALKEQKKKLILLSNISEAHFTYARAHFPALALFDGAVLSYEARAAKPSPAIYQAVLSLANAAPYECFYTDDIAEHIHAAKSLGIDAEIFTSTEQLIQHLAARSLYV